MSSRLVHPSRLFLASLLVSLVLHGLIVAGFIWLRFPQPSTPNPQPSVLYLEVSHVELSSAETPDETAPAEDEVQGSKFKVQSSEATNPPLTPPNLELETLNLKLSSPDLEPEALNFKPETLNFQLQPSAPAPRQATIDAPPKPRQSIRPDYPRSSRLHGEEGDVALEISVAASGAVEDVRVIRSSGFSALDKAAIEAVRAAQFSPATSDGRAVASSARLTLKFKLR